MRCLLVLVLAFTCVSSASAKPMSDADKQKVIDTLSPRLEKSLGKKWDELLSRWQPKLKQAKTEEQFYSTLNAMLQAAGKSHIMLASPDIVRKRDEAATKDMNGRTGVWTRLVDGKAVVTRVEPGSPAEKAGIRPGYVITAVNKWSPDSLIKSLIKRSMHGESLRYAVLRQSAGPVGSKVTLSVLDQNDVKRDITLVRAKQSGDFTRFGYLPPWRMAFESRKLAEGKVGYLRFSIFMMPLMPKIREAINSFWRCDGIIIDLRNNPGGFGMMAIPIASIFLKDKCSLGTSRMRDSTIRYTILGNGDPYKGKLIFLTDQGTASTSEILAGGMQELGRAKVVGQRTAGAVLASIFIKLPNGAQLQYPVGDYKTPKGTELEGVGVSPDVTVKLTRKEILKQGDPVLKVAVDMILGKQTEGKK